MSHPTVAVIPARGGSKGIPRKNVAQVAGRPLLAWAVHAAKNARTVDDVYVSTDDLEIAAVAGRFGAKVIRRPAEISGDSATSESALLHALDSLQDTGVTPGLLVFVQCTAPLLTPGDIDGTVRALQEAGADSAFAAVPFHHFLWRVDAAGLAVAVNHDAGFRKRRQDTEPQYLEAGSVYVMRPDGFRRAKHRFFGKTVLYATAHDLWLEADTVNELAVLDMILLKRQHTEKSRRLPCPVEAVVLDFDGVITDNRVITMQDGSEAVVCNRSDGLALERLRSAGVRLVVISTEPNPVVAARCGKLGVECVQGTRDKLTALRQWCSAHGVHIGRTVYVGNDVNDVECMRACGCGVAVADASVEAIEAAKVVLSASGGNGALRELCRLVLEANRRDQ